MPRHPLILALALQATGINARSWTKEPNLDAFWDYEHYLKAGRIAHRGTFASLWLPDFPMVAGDYDRTPIHALESTVLMAALGRDIPDIGVVPTISTSYNHPYNIARQIATVNALTDGRSGINAVTSFSPAVAQNFGDPRVPQYGDRFERAIEFMEIYRQLHESWQIPLDGPRRRAGYLWEPELRRPIDFKGRHFEVKGPLSVPQSRKGRPLVSIAGGSGHSLDFAARFADVLYTVLVHKQGAIDFSRDLRQRAQAHGRPADAVKVMPGLGVILGSTEAEVVRLRNEYAALQDPDLDPTSRVSRLLGLDPATLHPDRELTEAQLATPTQGWDRPLGFHVGLTDAIRRDRLTVRQIAERFPVDAGHNIMCGTPEQLAAQITDWWQSGAVDGFVIRPQVLIQDAELFSDHLYPLLRAAGVAPEGYRPESLVQRFGVPGA